MKKLFTLVFIVCCCITGNARRHYVNINATGLNNGTSWANAFADLSVPMDDNANMGDTFWVANGTYTSHTLEPYSFHILTNTVLYGGFDGSETMLSQRNFSNYQTILTGTNTYGNSIIVAVGGGRLDGFRITHSLSPSAQNTYFGIQLTGNFVMANCLITNIWNMRPVSVNGGGAVDILNCTFTNNGPSLSSSASIRGSALYCFDNQTRVNVTDCLFKNNQGTFGGAIYQKNASHVTVNRCIFYGNSAINAGGAIYDEAGAKLRLFNSIIVGNKAPIGGAHYTADSLNGSHNFTHCTIAHNWSSNAAPANYALWLNGTKDTLRNCILWGDSTGTGPEVPNPKSGAVFSKNLIRGGASIFGASGTYTFNPLFLSPGTVTAAPFAAASAYNYHLSPFSPAVDTGANLSLAAPYNLDLDGNARAQGRFPDLGAYEWKACAWHNVTISPSGPTTFCLPGSVMLTASGNPSYNHTYQWNGGAQTGATITVTTSGVNQVVVVDSVGCRSAAAVTVNAVPVPNPVITQSGNTLSVPATYATYQWYLNGNLITGATSATYQPTTYGNYTVKVTTITGGCQGTSAAHNMLNLAVHGTLPDYALHIYPNPGDGHLSISLDGQHAVSDVTITIRSITGQEVLRQQYRPSTKSFTKMVDISSAAKGVYFVEVVADGARVVKSLLIQ